MLTAGLVAVVGPAILAHEIEDALVDRLGAPRCRERGPLVSRESGKTNVSQLSSPSEGSDYMATAS